MEHAREHVNIRRRRLSFALIHRSFCDAVRSSVHSIVWRDPMSRYGKKASQKVKRALHELKRGKLKSGRSGKKVTSRKQAIAIGLSEARRAGGKVPRRGSRRLKK